MKGREYKDAVFENFAKMALAFAAPKRLEIIDILAQAERDVDSLSKEANMTIANTSRHLQVLKSTRLVKSRRDGVRIFYSLSDNDVFLCWKNLQAMSEKRVSEIIEVNRIFHEERNSMETISVPELWQRIQNDTVTVLDLRPEVEYNQSHIPNSISIPLNQLKDKLNELPKDVEIVAYCRGPYCVLSPEAVSFLKANGFHAIRMEEGLPEWKQAGLPIAF